MNQSRFVEAALGNSGGWTHERLAKIPAYKVSIVELLKTGMFVSEIGEQLDISPRTIRKWREEDVEFREACSDAETHSIDQYEREARRRAVQGVTEMVVAGGRVVMDPTNPNEPLRVRKYSDELLKFILKGRRRDVYGDHVRTENAHAFDMTGVKDELARKLAAALGSQAEAPGDPGDPAGSQ